MRRLVVGREARFRWQSELPLQQREVLVQAFLNDRREAPQPPSPSNPLFGSGCVHGNWPAKQLY